MGRNQSPRWATAHAVDERAFALRTHACGRVCGLPHDLRLEARRWTNLDGNGLREQMIDVPLLQAHHVTDALWSKCDCRIQVLAVTGLLALCAPPPSVLPD